MENTYTGISLIRVFMLMTYIYIYIYIYIYKKVANRVCYTIYNLRTAEQILMIFSFFGFVSASQNGLNIKKIGKVTKKFPEKPGSISLELIFT